MARTCIYCAKALNKNETCTCRRSSGTQKATGSQTGRPRGTGRTGKKPWYKRLAAYLNPVAQGPRKARQPSPVEPIEWRTLLVFITRPVDALRTVHLSSRSRMTGLVNAAHSLLTGLFFLVLSRQPLVKALLTAPLSGPAFGWLMFLLGCILGAAGPLLQAALVGLAFRFVLRRPLGVRLLINGTSSAFIYLTLFIFLALLLSPTTLIGSLFCLVAGWGLAGVAQFISVQRLSGTGENQAFLLTGLVLFVYTAMMAFVLRLAWAALFAG